MDQSEGWGRVQGRETAKHLLALIEANPMVRIFRISTAGVSRLDTSFASESIVEIAHRFRGRKGFCFFDLADSDMIENWEAAAAKKRQPLLSWDRDRGRVLGVEPSQGNKDALAFALSRPTTRAAELVEFLPNVSITNASTKLKQVWDQGFLLRRESVADGGGVEFVYERIY